MEDRIRIINEVEHNDVVPEPVQEFRSVQFIVEVPLYSVQEMGDRR